MVSAPRERRAGASRARARRTGSAHGARDAPRARPGGGDGRPAARARRGPRRGGHQLRPERSAASARCSLGPDRREVRHAVKIAVFGLGYVGTVTAAALASTGHEVIGVDTDERKVATLAAGQTPVLEPGLAELIAAETAAGRLTATTDGVAAAASAEL